MKPLSKWTDKAIDRRGRAILREFETYSRSDPFGWDWPTMRMIFPELCAEWDRLKSEWRRRHAHPAAV